MADIQVMRKFVIDLYPKRSRWRHKVNAMPDNQVMAIYFRESKKAEEAEAEQKDKEEDDDIPF